MAAAGEILYNDILRDIYDSEELKIKSDRCRALKVPLKNYALDRTVFLVVIEKLRKEIDAKKLVGKRNLYQVSYMYQVERLPVLVEELGKEQQDTRKEGSMTDSILWQV